MLDLFTIFSKGGIVLWCFQGTEQALTYSVNALIKSVILQERGGSDFTHEALAMKYKLDNEFELVFVVAYQQILTLSYVDKLLSDVAMEFRNKYKNDLQRGVGRTSSRDFNDFSSVFQELMRNAEEEAKLESKAPKPMRSFKQSNKSQKNVGSMIENKSTPESKSKKSIKKDGLDIMASEAKNSSKKENIAPEPVRETKKQATNKGHPGSGDLDDETIAKNRAKLFTKMNRQTSPKPTNDSSPSSEPKKRVKQATKWELGGTSADTKLDHGEKYDDSQLEAAALEGLDRGLVGQMQGDLRDIEEESDEEEARPTQSKQQGKQQSKPKKTGGFSLLNNLMSLVGSKALTREDMAVALEKMKEHLITKNVAVDIADQLCQSLATKLEGRVLSTFETVAATVRSALQDACLTLLTPRRRIDILRDALAARDARRPYVVTFCGVNGVGKSTNLAKICFWLIENGLRVLIAACDTFRAGAVEQLRTHKRKLNALHPPGAHAGSTMVELYEKGYGKDAAGIAMEAINYARDARYDVVLVDTAGRMQDNEPLMRALAKLMAVNQPDLVLFVGEALVGNEAVDQLVKFNQALADHSQTSNPRLIDGIVLTKFDTIDDKVGAAISMTYTTGQPIVFVGTGQTYTDLKNLNAKAVVTALLNS